MKNPIQITRQNKDLEETVDARELHELLGSKQDFTHWIKNRLIDSEDFEENVDYILLDKKNEQVHGGHNRKDYSLTLDTAKSIGLLERTDKGTEIRKYFIARDKEATRLEAELKKARLQIYMMQEKELIGAKSRLKAIANTEEIKALNAKGDTYALLEDYLWKNIYGDRLPEDYTYKELKLIEKGFKRKYLGRNQTVPDEALARHSEIIRLMPIAKQKEKDEAKLLKELKAKVKKLSGEVL